MRSQRPSASRRWWVEYGIVKVKRRDPTETATLVLSFCRCERVLTKLQLYGHVCGAACEATLSDRT